MTNQLTDAEIKAAKLKQTLFQRTVLDPTNKAKLADYKRGYVIYKVGK